VSEALSAAEVRRAAVLWDGLSDFTSATVTNAMDARVRRPAEVAKAPLAAVFLHPLGQGRAVAEYPPVRAELAPRERVFFLGYAGISDGFDWQDTENPPDGVRFYVAVDGKDVAQVSVTTSGWQPLVAAVHEAGPAGGSYAAALTLADDSGPQENPSYDWALFGAPLLVAVDGRPLPQANPVAGTSGVLVASNVEGTGRLLVEGLDAAGDPVPGATAIATVEQGAAMAFVRFDFGDETRCRQWRWRAEGEVRAAMAWGGSWQPSARIEYAGPTVSAVTAHEPLRFRVGVRNTGLGTLLPEHGLSVVCAGQRQPLARIAPGQAAVIEFNLGPAGQAPIQIVAETEGAADASSLAVPRPPLWPPLPEVPANARTDRRPAGLVCLDLGPDYLLVQNSQSRWLVSKAGLGAAVSVWTGTRFEEAGVVAPWAEIADSATGDCRPLAFADITASTRRGRILLQANAEVAAGVTCSLHCELKAYTPALQVELVLEAKQPLALRGFRGPAVHAGERAGGTGKGIAIFPGLEYLEGDERSSSERDLAPPLSQRWAPHKFKVTVPMMLVETRTGGPVLGIAWNAAQAWDGKAIAPGASFASPDFLTLQDSHLMQLMLPSVPEGIPEHQRLAEAPIRVRPGSAWRLRQFLVAGLPEPDATGALVWYDSLVGYPQAEKPPRNVADEIALCRHSFMVTAWDAEKQQGRHCVGWDSANAPGFATLMLMDARAVAKGQARADLLERVQLIGEKTVREQGAPGLTSSACCHTLGWEFPYHWGYLPDALEGMRAAAFDCLQNQEADGLWGYYPGKDHESLGEPGTRTMGICGRHAYLMAKYAAITGDPEIRAGLERALTAMARFRVPRGAQGWECPILEPDVLASAYAIRAYVWASMATGDHTWLEQARFWARTGLPFQYVWDDGEHPGMRYASIPVFGSTFFVHTWIGLPVQWCGLVYAYALQELLRFGADSLWTRQVEGMTVSAMWQQWPLDNPELAGTYPDSYGQWFTVRNPVHINPENIQLNLLALQGLDPGLRAVPVPLGAALAHVTAPCEVSAVATGVDGLRVDLRYLPRQIVYLTVGAMAPMAGFRAEADGKALAERPDLPPGSTGWCVRDRVATIVLGVPCDGRGKARVLLSGLQGAAPVQPSAVSAWDFAAGVESWTGDHACRVAPFEGALRITVAGVDPYAVSGPARIAAGQHQSLALRLRLSAGSGVSLFWRSTASPHWGPDKEVTLAVPGDGQWHEVAFDLAGHALWTGRILQIRLDLEPAGVPPGTTLDVDWIHPR
jgi:hypothetical protein